MWDDDYDKKVRENDSGKQSSEPTTLRIEKAAARWIEMVYLK